MSKRWSVVVLAVLLPFGGCVLEPAKEKAEALREPAPAAQKVVYASKLGYDPVDATQALQAAIASGAQKVIIENMGTPWIVDKIQLASDQEIVFEKGVVVQAKRGAFKGTGDCLFTASLKKNVTLTGYGATFKMWKEDYHGPDYKKAEWRHTLSIRSCDNVKVFGLTLASSGGDGIYLGVSQRGVTNTNVHIKDVVCVDNNRQGISVISAENLLIEDTIIKDTWGTAPQAGIDFEPNEASEKLVNIVMRNCVSENNRGDAYDFYIPTLRGDSAEVSVRLENCRSIGCARGLALTTGNDAAGAVKGRIEFVNCKFEASEHSGITINRKPVIGCQVRFENCEIVDCAAKQPAETPITLMSSSKDSEPIGGVEFINCVLKDPVDRLPMSYMDSAGGLRLANVTGVLTVERDGQPRSKSASELSRKDGAYNLERGQRTTHTLDQKLIEKWMPHAVFKEIKKFETKGVRYEPVNPSAKPESFGKCSARQREHAEYLLWAEAGQNASFTVVLQPVGKGTPKPTPVCLISPSGKKTPLADVQAGEGTPYSFTAEEAGAYKIFCEPGGSTTQVHSTTNRVCQYAEGSSFHFLSTTGEFFFWVPPGVAEFAVRVSGDNPAERVKAALHDMAGKLVEEKDDLAQAHQFLGTRGDASKGEIWSLRLGKPSHGVLEDFHVRLQGIPPVLSASRDALLKPAK
jgi:hypothetical protein